MSEVVCLVESFCAEVLYHLDGAGIEHVEVGPLLPGQASHSEAVDAGQAIHQLWTHSIQFLPTGGKAKVSSLRNHLQWPRASHHVVGFSKLMSCICIVRFVTSVGLK